MSARLVPAPDPLADTVATGPSFTQLFEAEFSYVWSTLRRFGVADRDLEDLTQEVFVRVHAQLTQYDPARPVRPWLFGIALGVASNFLRLARHRIDLVGEVSDVSDPGRRADERIEEMEERNVVHQALQSVELHFRAVLLLHDMEGYSIPDVANALGIGLSTTYSRLRLGRESFRSVVTRILRRRGMR